MAEMLPEWASDTPVAPDFELVMWESHEGGSALQAVHITVEEYIALKKHLAALRGLGAPSASDAIRRINSSEHTLAKLYASQDHQQVVFHLETARNLYSIFPDLVTVQSDRLDAELAKFASEPEGLDG